MITRYVEVIFFCFNVNCKFYGYCNSERILKMGQYLTKLRVEHLGFTIFGPPCILVRDERNSRVHGIHSSGGSRGHWRATHAAPQRACLGRDLAKWNVCSRSDCYALLSLFQKAFMKFCIFFHELGCPSYSSPKPDLQISQHSNRISEYTLWSIKNETFIFTITLAKIDRFQ